MEVSKNDEVIGLIAAAVQRGQAEIPEERRKLEEQILKILVTGFIRQLDDGRLKTALDNAIKPVKGNNPIVVEHCSEASSSRSSSWKPRK